MSNEILSTAAECATTQNQAVAQTANGQQSGTRPTAERFRPAVDIVERNDAVVLQADLPGVDETEMELTVEKQILKLRGTRRMEEFPGYKLVHQEHGARNYEREFRLSEELNRDGIEAAVHEGVLELTIPRLQPAGPQKIAIRTKGE